MKRSIKPNSRPTPLQDLILETLETHGHLTDEQLSLRTGKCLSAISKARGVLHADKLIHVADYCRHKQKGPWTRVWSVGRGVDADAPIPKTSNAKSRDYRRRKRARLRSVLELLL